MKTPSTDVPRFQMRTRRKRQAGALVVEFALVFPLFVAVLLGFFDLMYMMRDYAVITNAAREGARVGTVWASTPGNRPTATTIANTATGYATSNMINVGTTGSAAPSAIVSTGPAGSLVTITGTTRACASSGDLLQVEVDFTTGNAYLMYSIYRVVLPNMTFAATATMRCE